MSNVVPVVTIDGPSGVGKGTMCRKVAKYLGWHILDSGSLYRILAYAMIKHGIYLDSEQEIVECAKNLDVKFNESKSLMYTQIEFEGNDITSKIRTEDVGGVASKIAQLQSVRDTLINLQRDFQKEPGLVSDGRDMGTVVFPNAELKIFLTATADARANRRYLQLIESGNNVNIRQILNELSVRDERDKSRVVAPLKPADDAVIIDTSSLGVDEVFEVITKHFKDTVSV